MDKTDQQLLRLIVSEDRVRWEWHKCDLEGRPQSTIDREKEAGILLAENSETLRERIKTLALLIDLQQLVADMRREGKWDAKELEDIAYRVVEALGERLYRFLFPGELVKVLNSALAATAGGSLRIELEFQEAADDVYGSWPWEYLRSPKEQGIRGSGAFLALQAQLVLNRHLFIRGAASGLKTGRPVVLLVVAGWPEKPLSDEFGVVEADKVITTLHHLRDAEVIDLIELVEPRFEFREGWIPTASWEAFKKVVKNRKPDVVHFIGHGQRVYDPNGRSEYTELIFVGEDSKPEPVRDSDFLQAIKKGANLKLVFLQACESGVRGPRASATSVAQLLAHEGIPAVVAMQAKVENVVANTFAEAFYTALRDHKPIDWAVREGREAIEDVPEHLKLAFGVPVLFLQSYEPLINPVAIGEVPTRQSATVVPTSVPHRDEAAPKRASYVSCPRCGFTEIDDVCAKCGLRLICDCGGVLAVDPDAPNTSPMARFCPKCGREIQQRPWTTSDKVESSSLRGSLRGVSTSGGGKPNTEDVIEKGEEQVGADVARLGAGLTL